ncbi:MAG: YdbH domain-containing protein [Chlorobiales bacterium]|nr:YdbH domain-containing protein [Chlorobiales bacterium]
MTWLKRILLCVFLLLVLMPAAGWFFFPWYAQSLVDRGLEGKPFRIELSGLGLPGFSGVGFRSMKVLFTTPKDGCSDASTYTLSLTNGLLSWHFVNRDTTVTRLQLPKVFNAAFTLDADSINVKPDPEAFNFGDSKPRITASIDVSRKNGFTFFFIPIAAVYNINGATVTREKLRLEDVNFKVKLSAADHWQQGMDTLRVAKLFSDGNPSPVSNFKALFGSKRDPLKPCTLTLTGCSVDLYHWKASTQRIEYDLKEKQSRFTLNLAEIPLAELPGFNRGGSKTPLATGRVSGFIPIEFQDSTVLVRNALVLAGKGTSVIFYTKENKPLLSLDLGVGEVLKNLNARVTLNSRNNKLSGLAMSNLSATLLGGTITSTPVSFNPAANNTLLTLKLNNIKVLDRVRLHGDFKGSLKGAVSGTIPLTIAKSGFAIRNAHLQSPGGGTITIAPPSKRQSASERIFGPQKPDADYTFSEPDLVFSRLLNGSTTITFTLKNLLRKTEGGEMPLLSPRGTLSLWQNRLNPDMATLSDFSAEFFGGTVALKHVDYDMRKKEGETELQLDNIPLQKLLDLQGTKKVYATGTVKGTIPVKMKNDVFEIKDGGMNAEQSGQIIYATTPEERAAANQGLRTTYEALSNFLYVQLISSINMAPDGKSAITIQLKGTNPDFQNGRPIELNLNVEQNMLDLMRSLSISSNVEQIISEKALQMQKKK